MVSPGGIVLVGIGFLILSRLRASSKGKSTSGIMRDPPGWIRQLFADRNVRVQLDDVLVGAIGALWAIGGAGLIVAGPNNESQAFWVVEVVLVAVFLMGGLLAVVIWARRELR